MNYGNILQYFGQDNGGQSAGSEFEGSESEGSEFEGSESEGSEFGPEPSDETVQQPGAVPSK